MCVQIMIFFRELGLRIYGYHFFHNKYVLGMFVVLRVRGDGDGGVLLMHMLELGCGNVASHFSVQHMYAVCVA